MRTSWHGIWGSGRGPATRLAPRTRIAAGALIFAACLTAPAVSLPGIIMIAAAAAAWSAACRMPGRTALSFALLGMALFLPYFFLAPILPEGTGGLAVPLSIVIHGLAGLFIATSTIAVLTASDWRDGLLALPVPRVVAALLIQIVHQTSGLIAETKRVASAVAVRGASGTGSAAFRAMTSLPRVWLPRIIDRAERLAAAMEFRGYAEVDLGVFGSRRGGAADAAVTALAAGVLVLAACLRWGLPS